MHPHHRPDRYAKPIETITAEPFLCLADRRGLLHFLRSNHGPANETTTRSRRTSRSLTADSRQNGDYSNEALDRSENLEHKRVIDSFVVSMRR